LTESADSRTGLRIRDLGSELADDEALAGFPSLLGGLATLDGFGTTAPLFIRFTGPIDAASLPAAGSEIDPAQSSLVLVDLDASTPSDSPMRPRFLEFDWEIVEEADGGTTLFVDPLRPLRAGARHGLVLTRAALGGDGDCIAPSPTMRAILSDEADDATRERIGAPIVDLVAVMQDAGAIEGPTDLSAAIVFTTQRPLEESTAIAKAIAAAMPPPSTPTGCVSKYAYPYRECEVVLRMADFTDANGIVTGAPVPQGFYDVPATAWLPDEGDGPFPTVIFGHALTGERHSASWFAFLLTQSGYAVVAIDAPKHGDHPDRAIGNSALDLFGLGGDPLDPFLALSARDNFRQAAYDKLQLVRAIEAGLNVTPDGQPDFDFKRLHYIGTSLGAVMAPQFLAYAPAIRSATMIVGGARLTEIVQGEDLSNLIAFLTASLTDDERVRMLAIAQTAIDGGDPELFAPWVVADRISGFEGARPNVLVQMAVDDAVVPNSSTAVLTRALELPIVGPVPVALRDVAVHGGLPVSANLALGRTAGLYQFVQGYEYETDELEPATHYNVQSDPGANEQARRFVVSTDADGATIIDPLSP
ncbi:MAG TPA: hypothetical protein VFG69_05535, partial [Nannocystaceae bacterium]|nr:hypothetical protein [Nannocystaceae bacterium]